MSGNVDSYDWRIDNAARQHRISWNKARALRAELRRVKPIAWRVQTGQASGWERDRLERTMGRIQSALNGYGRPAYRGYRR